MIPLNQASIRRKLLRFWMLFVLLMVFTALPSLCFIWTASSRHQDRQAELAEDERKMQRGRVLYSKTNSLFDAVNAIRSDDPMAYRKQGDELFALTTSMDKITGADSAGIFAGYTRIARNIQALLLARYSNAARQAQLNRHVNEALENDAIRRDIYNHRQ